MLRIADVAEKYGVHVNTVRRWVKEGRLRAHRTKGNQRVFYEEDLQEKTNQSIILYARVSSAKQRNDLERQRQFLQEHIPSRFASHPILHIHDIASGLNFKRPGLLRLMELVKEGNISTVIVASRDRLCRFGFELVEWMCQQHGTEILVLRHEDTTPEQELGEDLMSIVQVYCCRWNGKRRYKTAQRNSSDEETSSSTDQGTETAAL